MPSTADHKAHMHCLSMERRRAGRPVWDHHIRIAHI
jgi:hypothetical protein